MKTKMILKMILLITVSFWFCSTVLAGTQAIMQDIDQDNNSNSRQTNHTTISVEANLIRFAHSSNSESEMIFDSNKKEMIVIDHQEKTFIRMDQTYFKKLQQTMSDARKQMEAQMAQIPAEQREMMKQMMGDKMKMFDKPIKKEIKFNKTNRKSQAAGYDCLITETSVNGVKTNEFCVTETSKVKGAQFIFDALVGMSELFKEFYESMNENFPMQAEVNPFAELNQLNGFPIKVVTYSQGKISEQSELKSIETKSFDKSYFLPPKGYKENKMSDMGL